MFTSSHPRLPPQILGVVRRLVAHRDFVVVLLHQVVVGEAGELQIRIQNIFPEYCVDRFASKN